MKNNIIFSFLALIMLVPVLLFAQTDKKKIYTLKEGEQIGYLESSLGVTANGSGYLLMLQRESGIYILVNGKEMGPFDYYIPESRSADGKMLAVIAPSFLTPEERSAEVPPSQTYQIIMNDGKVYGPYKDLPFISFNADATNWAIEVHHSEEEKNTDPIVYKETTYIRFKDGKEINLEGNGMVTFNPMSSNSWMINMYADGKTSLMFSDGKKSGPYDFAINPQFLPENNGYAFVHIDNGATYLNLNGTDTKIEHEEGMELFSPYFSNDGKDWALHFSKQEEGNSNYILFKNGTKSEYFDKIYGPIIYNKQRKTWVWGVELGDKREVFVYESDGKKWGPYPPAAEYSSGYTFSSEDGSVWGISYIQGDELYSYYYNDGKSPKLKNFVPENGENCISAAFDAQNQVYFITTKGREVNNEIIESYFLSYPEKREKRETKAIPDVIEFSTSKQTSWINYPYENVLEISDGTKYENIFGVRYEKAEGKLYWLTLEGNELFVLSKSVK
jgi:hypothetical protein